MNTTPKSEYFKVGDKVNYHSIIGGKITTTDHEITSLMFEPNDFGTDVARITNKSGYVALDALSHIEVVK